MEIANLIPHIEALIFASEKPLTTLEITELVNNTFEEGEEKVSLDQVEAALEGIREKYSAEFYPFEVKQSGGGWQFLTKVSFHKTVAQLNKDKFLKKLREQNPPIIARTADNKVLLDPRTVQPEQEGALLVGLKNALRKT